MEQGPPLPSPHEQEALRVQAERRVKQKIALVSHLSVYLVINIFLVVVWSLSGAGYPWFLWVMAGWGLGVLLQVFAYFTGSKGEAARERMIRKEMNKIKKERGDQS